jgi:hypothetical protein
MTIYDGYSTWNAGEYPAVLAIGDSWFWYPGNNLLDALANHPKLKDPFRHMVRLGENGALLSEYVDLPGRPGRLGKRLKDLLQRDPMQYFSVFAVSGAGNDAVDYSLGLKPDCSGAATPADCVSDEGMSALLRGVTQAMSLLLHEVLWAFEAQARHPAVLLHGYDYAVPDARGFALAGIPVTGPWLASAMDARGVPTDAALRGGVVKILIDRLNAAFARYASPAAGIHFVDSRGTLDSGSGYQGDWENELHPTPAGFDRIVDRRWIPVLQGLGIARA